MYQSSEVSNRGQRTVKKANVLDSGNVDLALNSGIIRSRRIFADARWDAEEVSGIVPP